MNITSGFALLDVKKGRHKLAKHFTKRPPLGPCPPELRIPVVITGFIDGVHSRDDGTSIEFQVEVTGVNNIFERCPDLGARTPEPSLREIVAGYYRRVFSAAETRELTEKYIQAVSK